MAALLQNQWQASSGIRHKILAFKSVPIGWSTKLLLTSITLSAASLNVLVRSLIFPP